MKKFCSTCGNQLELSQRYCAQCSAVNPFFVPAFTLLSDQTSVLDKLREEKERIEKELHEKEEAQAEFIRQENLRKEKEEEERQRILSEQRRKVEAEIAEKERLVREEMERAKAEADLLLKEKLKREQEEREKMEAELKQEIIRVKEETELQKKQTADLVNEVREGLQHIDAENQRLRSKLEILQKQIPAKEKEIEEVVFQEPIVERHEILVVENEHFPVLEEIIEPVAEKQEEPIVEAFQPLITETEETHWENKLPSEEPVQNIVIEADVPVFIPESTQDQVSVETEVPVQAGKRRVAAVILLLFFTAIAFAGIYFINKKPQPEVQTEISSNESVPATSAEQSQPVESSTATDPSPDENAIPDEKASVPETEKERAVAEKKAESAPREYSKPKSFAVINEQKIKEDLVGKKMAGCGIVVENLNEIESVSGLLLVERVVSSGLLKYKCTAKITQAGNTYTAVPYLYYAINGSLVNMDGNTCE